MAVIIERIDQITAFNNPDKDRKVPQPATPVQKLREKIRSGRISGFTSIDVPQSFPGVDPEYRYDQNLNTYVLVEEPKWKQLTLF